MTSGASPTLLGPEDTAAARASEFFAPPKPGRELFPQA